MNGNRLKSFFKAGVPSGLFLVSIVVASLYISQVQEPIVLTAVESIPRTWTNLGDGPLGAGASGFCYFMAYPHQAAPAVAYASNLSNATAYEYRDTLNGEMTGETPYSTAFDFVLKFRVNDTVGYNVSGSKWEISWVRANITCNFQYATDIPALSAMNIIEIANNSDYAWYHGYINNAAAGYQITKGETYNCSTIRAQGYY